jgi:AbrB family looped-hinge helix DNA binding protein
MESSIMTTKGQIVIPKILREKYKLSAGTKLIFRDTPNGIILQPLDADYIKSLRGFIKSNDPRPMKVWWAEYKKEELDLEDRKLTLHEPKAVYNRKPTTVKKKKK